jgi:hypothetical protein
MKGFLLLLLFMVSNVSAKHLNFDEIWGFDDSPHEFEFYVKPKFIESNGGLSVNLNPSAGYTYHITNIHSFKIKIENNLNIQRIVSQNNSTLNIKYVYDF